MDFSKNIKYALEKRNLTIRDLSNKAGIPEQSLYKMIRSNEFKASVLHQIALALEFETQEFFEEFDFFKGHVDRRMVSELSPERTNIELMLKKSEIEINQNKLNELNQKIRDLTKQIQVLEKQINYSIDYVEFERLKELIVKNSVKGSGLVYLDYKLIKRTFLTHFKPLKEKISLKSLKNIEFDEMFGDLTSNEDNIEFDVLPEDEK